MSEDLAQVYEMWCAFKASPEYHRMIVEHGFKPQFRGIEVATLETYGKQRHEQPKHDGKLGKHEVSFWQEFVCIEEADGLLEEPEHVQLTAEQALSLLAWLEENKAKLIALTKAEEQANNG